MEEDMMRKSMSVVCLVGASLLIAACGDDDGDGGAVADAAPVVPDAAPTDAADGALQLVLAGENEVPPVATPASGEVDTTLDGDVLTVSGAFSDLEADLLEVSGSSAHIHRGDVDENGPIVFNLDVTSADARSGTLAGTFELTAAQRMLFEEGLLYVNVHTELNPAGELRGQLSPEQPSLAAVDATFDAELLPENETAAVDSDASGTSTAVVRGRQLTLSGPFAGLTSPLMEVAGSPAHVHVAAPGDDGPVVFPISVFPGDDMRSGRLSVTRTLTDDELAALAAGDYYVNVHTDNYPAGEIRGQLIQR
jgi:hypothetical protein